MRCFMITDNRGRVLMTPADKRDPLFYEDHRAHVRAIIEDKWGTPTAIRVAQKVREGC